MAMHHPHLSSLDAFDALLRVKSLEAFFQVLAQAIREFASFNPAHLIDFCRFMGGFIHAWAEMTPDQMHAGLLAAELDDARTNLGRIAMYR
jgi:hypothetical protein